MDRLPTARDSVAGLRRCGCPGTCVGAGHRSDGQLFQPGALRPGNHDAVGLGDLLPAGSVGIRRSAFTRRCLDGSGGPGCAADVPLRIDLERTGIRRIDLPGPAVQVGARAPVRRLCGRLLRGSLLSSSCCATTPRPTSRESGSIRSHRRSCSSGPWSTSFWRRRAARIPRRCAATSTQRRNPKNLEPAPALATVAAASAATAAAPVAASEDRPNRPNQVTSRRLKQRHRLSRKPWRPKAQQDREVAEPEPAEAEVAEPETARGRSRASRRGRSRRARAAEAEVAEPEAAEAEVAGACGG